MTEGIMFRAVYLVSRGAPTGVDFMFDETSRDELLERAEEKMPRGRRLSSIEHIQSGKTIWQKPVSRRKAGWTKDADKVLPF